MFLHHVAGKDEALGFAIESVLGKWLNQNSVVNAIVNGHGEFYDKMKSLSEITPIADNQDHGYSVQPTLDFDAFNLDDDKQSFDIDVAMKSFRPTSADPERLFSLTRISRILNGLSFHPSKCKCIPFSDVMPDLMLNLGSNELPFEKSIEDLGFTVTSNLDWTNHIETKLAKCTRVFNFMRRNIPFSTASPRKKLLYHSLVVSVLLYGSPVWSPSVTYLKKLEKFQMRAFKWICSDKSYKSALLSHSYLPLCFQLAENDLILLWKLQNRCLDVDHNLATSTLNTRSSTLGLFDDPKTKKVGSESNFFVRSTRAANALISLKVLDFSMSLQHFKLVLRNFLLSKISNFDISNSCSLFIKCYCSFCRS